jgi:A/G-specific adenine glycosylase
VNILLATSARSQIGSREKLTVSKLISWHKKNYCGYPFRNEEDPYRILVGEILLRQTRARQVSGVYPRLVREYPRIADLARADANRLRHQIKSLGMKSRVRDLLTIAKKVELDFGGEVPSDRKALVALPGVGDYIANSVLVRAFGKRYPLVDSNVARVLSRVFSGPHSNSKKHAEAVFMDLSRFSEPGALNYAIIDFAHSLCASTNPKCRICPLARSCSYFERTRSTSRSHVREPEGLGKGI